MRVYAHFLEIEQSENCPTQLHIIGRGIWDIKE